MGGHTNQEAVRNVYAFDLTLNVPIHIDSHQDTKWEEQKMIIDGYGLREMIVAQNRQNPNMSKYSAHLIYINDCRKDINIEHPTVDDTKYWNVDFVEAEVNGFAMVFVVTRCDIQKNTELLSWYGEHYNTALAQHDEYQRMKNFVTTLVDNSILQGVDLSNDVWTID